MTDHPTLQTFVKRGRKYEVRHLLIAGNDPGAKTLSKIVNGIQTRIAVGTQYEMQKQEGELMKEWSGDGFESERHAFESWERTLTLLTAMNHHVIYDPQQADVRKLNLTGAVPLTEWSGRTAKDGGDYEYAFDGTKVLAQPKLPANAMPSYTTTVEFAKALVQVSKLRESLGPLYEFILAD